MEAFFQRHLKRYPNSIILTVSVRLEMHANSGALRPVQWRSFAVFLDFLNSTLTYTSVRFVSSQLHLVPFFWDDSSDRLDLI